MGEISAYVQSPIIEKDSMNNTILSLTLRDISFRIQIVKHLYGGVHGSAASPPLTSHLSH